MLLPLSLVTTPLITIENPTNSLPYCEDKTTASEMTVSGIKLAGNCSFITSKPERYNCAGVRGVSPNSCGSCQSLDSSTDLFLVQIKITNLDRTKNYKNIVLTCDWVR